MSRLAYICFLSLILFAGESILAQNSKFYYYNGTAQYFTDDSMSVNIILADTGDIRNICNNLYLYFSGQAEVSYSDEDDNIIVTNRSLSCYHIDSVIKSVTNNHPEKVIYYSYSKNLDGERVWLRNEVVAKIKSINLISSAISIINEYSNVSVTLEDALYLTILCPDENTVISLAKRLFESGLFVFAEPDYYCSYENHYNDPLYSKQYYLHNTGQSVSLVDGSNFQCVSGFDLKVLEAWSLVSSLSTVSTKVAIIDDGVEDHEDLMSEGNSKVLNGYPAINHGRPKFLHAHGQCCAGIVAATPNNGKGIVGIDQNSRIVPIRIQKIVNIISGDPKTDYMNNKRIAKGIRKAWELYEADILNNSWGHKKNKSQQVQDAFKMALDNGRNNKGCVVIASSGNDFKNDSINFIGTIPRVISVGAIQGDGLHGLYSNYSSDLNVVAFGGYALYDQSTTPPTGYCDIRTIDREGNKGFNDSGNYYEYFGMTSAAAPMVSGVASLMLSVNPNLENDHVKEIIEKTAYKLPTYTFSPASSTHPNGSWNEKVGYGLVDAHKAVVYAMEYGYDIAIIGDDNLSDCESNTYFCSILHPELFTYQWSCSSNLSIANTNGGTVTVIPLSVGFGSVSVEVYQQNRLMYSLTKNIIVNSVWSCVTPLSTMDFTISSNTTWSSESYLPVTVEIASGSTLTITNNLLCGEGARLIVRPGGTLIVDGGTLTSACAGEMWQGIEVVGDRTKHQTAANQGTVILRNGATIENAHCAIRTGLEGNEWLTAGGIVQCSNSTFRNNRRAVSFYSYADTLSSGNIGDNKSWFKDCTFTLNNDNLFLSQNMEFLNHVTLWDVKGVSFEGCTFENLTTGNIPDRRHGIYALGAGLRIRSLCDRSLDNCNCHGTADTNLFKGFSTAVEVSNDGCPYTVTLDEAKFENNGTGVSIQACNYATVTRCVFDLSTSPLYPRGNTGLYLNKCTGYQVEGNAFRAAANATSPSRTGMVVDKSGYLDNSIYRNTLRNLDYGITVMDTNGSQRSGLCFTCNTFLDCDYGIYVDDNALVSLMQGSTTKGADNDFLGTQTSSFWNAGAWQVDYYYNYSQEHTPYNYSGVHPISAHVSPNPCNSTVCDQGGNTNPLANFAGLDVVVGTSDPSGAADGLGSGSGTSASQEDAALQAALGNYYAAVRRIMADSVENLQELAAWHAAAGIYADPYSLTEIGAVTGNGTGTSDTPMSQADASSTVQQMSPWERDNYADFRALAASLRPSANNPAVNWPAATPAQIDELQRIAEANTGRSSVMARGVLCFFFDICYGEEEGETKGLLLETFQGTSLQDGTTGGLLVYPNPTDGTVTVEATGDSPIWNVTVLDMSGRVLAGVTHTPHSENSYICTLDLRHLDSGLYLIRALTADGKTVSGKVVKN